MESTARGNRKPEITKESAAAAKNPPQSAKRDEKLHAQRDSCGAFLPFNERFSSLPVPKPVWFSNAVWANIRPSILAQEVLKEHSFCYELVWTKERSSIGGVIRARNRGLLPIPKGGNPIELLLSNGFDCE